MAHCTHLSKQTTDLFRALAWRNSAEHVAFSTFRNSTHNHTTCMTDTLQTHSSCVIFSYPCCSFRPWYTNFGPHQASARATNDTHVKQAVDNMKHLFLHSSLRSLLRDVGLRSDPSCFPLTGSCMAKMIKRTATIPNIGFTRSPHLQDPAKFAVPDPTI
jgi:hypothetical protein